MEQDISEPNYVNARTLPMFKEMLNQVGDSVKVGNKVVGYGDSLSKIDYELYISIYNQWVSKCCEAKIMYKTLSNDCTKSMRWMDELSDVEKAVKGMEVLKGII